MICPKCKTKTKIVDIVHNNEDAETYRKHKCTKCDHKFYTIEFEVEYDEKMKELYNKNHRYKTK